jgi:hypothetical protein
MALARATTQIAFIPNIIFWVAQVGLSFFTFILSSFFHTLIGGRPKVEGLSLRKAKAHAATPIHRIPGVIKPHCQP